MNFVSQGAGELNDERNELLDAVMELREVNPMLGTRGVRLARYAQDCTRLGVLPVPGGSQRNCGGCRPKIEVMIPLINDPVEFRLA